MSTPKSGCPSDETFTRLVEGLLPEAEVHALEAHCDGCLTCARLMAELARAISPSGGGLLDDRYRLLEPLGAGGMGVVYAAFDTKLGRKVAVKRLRETGAGTPAEKRRGRFLREAQLLASLSHPNVLTIHDVGGQDRELYVVMELVDGAPVSRWLTQTRPGWRAIVDVYLQAGRGLMAAHQLGIVHRDIKPDNILVANSGRVLVGDFGLAGLAGSLTPGGDAPPPSSPPGALAALTQTGAVLGTPAYMSPEQHDGKTGDALSDQFSFAVSLYESLHGRRPFAGLSASEIAAATRSGRLTPGGDGVPRGVDGVLAVALHPDPGRRFASMEVLLAALERARRRRPAVTALVAAAVLLAAGAVGARAWMHPGPRADLHQRNQQGETEKQRTENKDPEPSRSSGPPVLPVNHSASALDARPQPPAASPPRQRRQLAQAAPADPEQLLDRADRLADARDGAGCLAVLAEVRDLPADMAARAQEIRGDCEMLAGHCDAGRKLLEPMYEADRRFSPAAAKGVLAARVARMCPVSSFPTVEKRVLAVSLQANVAMSAAGDQSRWCGALERALLADTRSREVQDCFVAKPPESCALLMFSLEDAYLRLSECFLRDKNCREGARLDVMHSQIEGRGLALDDQRAPLNCRPTRVVEVYPACAAAGADAERKCLDHLESARRQGATRLNPEMP